MVVRSPHGVKTGICPARTHSAWHGPHSPGQGRRLENRRYALSLREREQLSGHAFPASRSPANLRRTNSVPSVNDSPSQRDTTFRFCTSWSPCVARPLASPHRSRRLSWAADLSASPQRARAEVRSRPAGGWVTFCERSLANAGPERAENQRRHDCNHRSRTGEALARVGERH